MANRCCVRFGLILGYPLYCLDHRGEAADLGDRRSESGSDRRSKREGIRPSDVWQELSCHSARGKSTGWGRERISLTF